MAEKCKVTFLDFQKKRKKVKNV